jgi:hypothetical protein
VYEAPDGKRYRPSMSLTLTCDSYGKVTADGTPADPAHYDYQRAARDALHFAALFDRYDPDDPLRSDVDLWHREIMVRGKGGQARVVRIGHEACERMICRSVPHRRACVLPAAHPDWGRAKPYCLSQEFEDCGSGCLAG